MDTFKYSEEAYLIKEELSRKNSTKRKKKKLVKVFDDTHRVLASLIIKKRRKKYCGTQSIYLYMCSFKLCSLKQYIKRSTMTQ